MINYVVEHFFKCFYPFMVPLENSPFISIQNLIYKTAITTIMLKTLPKFDLLKNDFDPFAPFKDDPLTSMTHK